MQFLHRDLGHLPQGSVVEVILDKQANVLLLTDAKFAAYRNGQDFGGSGAYGGWYTQSPVRLSVPHAGRWNVAVDLGDTVGQLSASINVLTLA